MAATNATTFPIVTSARRDFDLPEALIAFFGILLVLWLPTRQQLIAGPILVLAPLALTLWRRPSLDDLGLTWSRFLASLWILPAAAALGFAGALIARGIGTFHPLHNADFAHVGGYVVWTIYQQFLLQIYFMPRMIRALGKDGGIAATAVLFALAHLPNLSLTLVTLLWGAVSCLLFRRYRSLLVVGLAQGLLGLCFGVCVPDALHHHMRVGLGYLRYHA